MTNPDPYNPKILPLERLLDCWNFLTCQCVRMIPSVERALFEWSKLYVKADLELTLKYINYKNRKAEKKWQLRFEKFFDGDYSHFESIRAEAEQHDKALTAKKRAWVATPGQAAWAAAHGEEPTPPTTEPRMSKDLLLSNLDQLKNEIRKQ